MMHLRLPSPAFFIGRRMRPKPNFRVSSSTKQKTLPLLLSRRDIPIQPPASPTHPTPFPSLPSLPACKIRKGKGGWEKGFSFLPTRQPKLASEVEVAQILLAQLASFFVPISCEKQGRQQMVQSCYNTTALREKGKDPRPSLLFSRLVAFFPSRICIPPLLLLLSRICKRKGRNSVTKGQTKAPFLLSLLVHYHSKHKEKRKKEGRD